MKKKFTAKIFLNLNNNQYSLTLPRKKLMIPKDKVPKELDIEIKKVRF